MAAAGRVHPLLVLAAVLVGCGGDAAGKEPSDPQAAAAPAGDPDVVLRVDGVPIRASEVDHLADAVKLLYPEYTEPQRRRLALGSVLLPRAAVCAARPDQHDEALERARVVRAALAEGLPLPAGLEVTHLHGEWSQIGGLDLWAFARGLTPGAWSGPLDRIARLDVVRLRSIAPAADPRHEVLDLDVVTFPYLPAGTGAKELEEIEAGTGLAIVDPAWREVVPEIYQYRMRGKPR